MINANLSAFSVGKAVGRGGGPKSWQYTGTSFSVSSTGQPSDTVWDGTHLWVLQTPSDSLHKYTALGVNTGTSFSVQSQDTGPTGITWDGTYFWMVGRQL